MFNRYLTYFNPGLQFVAFLALLSMSWLLGSLLIEQLNINLTGYSTLELSKIENFTPELINKVKVINVLLLAFIFLIPALVFSYLAYPKPLQYLGLSNSSKSYYWLWALVLFIVAMPFTYLLEEWNAGFSFLAKYKLEDERIDKMYLAMLKVKTVNELGYNVLFICLAPAIVEEIFFRGLLQQLCSNWLRNNQWVAIVFVAFIFSAFHGQLNAFIPRFFLGLLLGLVYYYTSNLWITILLHFINNFISVLMMYLFYTNKISLNPLELPPVSIWFGLLSGVACLGFAYYFYLHRKPFQIIEVEKEPIEINDLFKK